MPLELRKASRKAVPLLISITSVSGGGKTYTALQLAAGLAAPGTRVGFIDTENGRGEMYADSPGIMASYPDGYDYIRLDPPFSPARYVEYVKALEEAKVSVGILDSASHEWSGIGGCCEVAENNPLGKMPNWSRAKMEHKRFVNHILSSGIHLILCFRGQEKVKIFKKGDRMVTGSKIPGDNAWPIAEKDCIIPIGVQAVTEKSMIFEATLSLCLDEFTHFAVPTKVPEPLFAIFNGKRLITKEDGTKVRLWNETARALDPFEQVKKRARAAASEGKVAYRTYFDTLTVQQKDALRKSIHEELKMDAEMADQDAEKLLAAEGGREEQ